MAVAKQTDAGTLPILPLLLEGIPRHSLPPAIRLFQHIELPRDPALIDFDRIVNVFRKKAALSRQSLSPDVGGRLLRPDRNSANRTNLNSRDSIDMIKRVRTMLLSELDSYERFLGWSDSHYLDLYADIEGFSTRVTRTLVRKPIVEQLMHSWRHTTNRIIVLGPPGGGKSVTLRHVYRRLLVQERAALPLYANFRDWPPGLEINSENIDAFLFSTLARSVGIHVNAFLQEAWNSFMAEKRLLLLLDSFDELPAIFSTSDIGDDPSRMSLFQVSTELDRYLQDSAAPFIIASRPYRRPVGIPGHELHLKVMGEKQIYLGIEKWTSDSVDAMSLVRKIHELRPELMAVLRNPFAAELLARYVRRSRGDLPPNVFTLFESSIDASVRRVLTGADGDEIVSQCISLAIFAALAIYRRNHTALSMPAETLRQRSGMQEFGERVRILCAAQVLMQDASGRIMFVHRRLAEFFYVRSLIELDLQPDVNQILGDSRFRDGLVVYAAIASDEKARGLAAACWNEISRLREPLLVGNIPRAITAIHSLRFLRDSYLGRLDVISDFHHDISSLVMEMLSSPNLLVAKLGAETIGLLNSDQRERAIQEALKQESDWIVETAFRSLLFAQTTGLATLLLLNRLMHTRSLWSYLSDLRSRAFLLQMAPTGRYLTYGLYSRLCAFLIPAVALSFLATQSGAVTWAAVDFLGLLALANLLCYIHHWLFPNFLSGYWPRQPTLRKWTWTELRRQISWQMTKRGEEPNFERTAYELRRRWPSGYAVFWAGTNRYSLARIRQKAGMGMVISVLGILSTVLSISVDGFSVFFNALAFGFALICVNPYLAAIGEVALVLHAHLKGRNLRDLLVLLCVIEFAILAFLFRTRVERFASLFYEELSELVVIGLLIPSLCLFLVVLSLGLTNRFRYTLYDRPRALRVAKEVNLTRDDLFAVLGRMKTERGRLYLLNLMLIRKSPLVDPERSFPAQEAQWLTRPVREKLARLEEQWMGLQQ